MPSEKDETDSFNFQMAFLFAISEWESNEEEDYCE